MIGVAGRRLALLGLVMLGGFMAMFESVEADGGPSGYLIYDISWPQCPTTTPQGGFHFAVIGLNNGYPFSTNDCFEFQYAWAKTVEEHPDVYINLDFPKPGNERALTGPYGRCTETDDWCRAYNYGYALAKDSHARAQRFGITPGRYWFDVEMINYWSNWPAANGQVVHGAVDYFLDMNLPIGIYGTSYQWGLITGNHVPEGATLPLWLAGATSIEHAAARCNDSSKLFAGGVAWLVQYPQDGFDGNVLCEAGRPERQAREARDAEVRTQRAADGAVAAASSGATATDTTTPEPPTTTEAAKPQRTATPRGTAVSDAGEYLEARRTPGTLQEALNQRYSLRLPVIVD